MRSTTERGYGGSHQRERDHWAPKVATGQVPCRRGTACLEPNLLIRPDEPWDLGHPDAACPAPKGPEHRRCNRAAGGRNGAAVTNTARQMTVRAWGDPA